jgi:hypothetical protein
MKSETNLIPTIKPLGKTSDFEVKQSKYGEHLPKLPMRAVIVGPSGSGKSLMLTNLIMDIYKNCFSRIYIFSPSIHLDMGWLVVKKYIEEDLKLKETDDDKFYYDHYDPADLQRILDNQKEVAEYMKKRPDKYKKIYQIMIVIDDFSDDLKFVHNSPLLFALYCRGRHSAISTIISSQSYVCQAPLIRKNMLSLFVFRLRNIRDYELIEQEIGALFSKKEFRQLYEYATNQPYGFLYLDLTAKDKNNMAYSKFEQKLIIED